MTDEEVKQQMAELQGRLAAVVSKYDLGKMSAGMRSRLRHEVAGLLQRWKEREEVWDIAKHIDIELTGPHGDDHRIDAVINVPPWLAEILKLDELAEQFKAPWQDLDAALEKDRG